jgi:hypothetical protein
VTGQWIGNSLMIIDDFDNVFWIIENSIPDETQVTQPCQINHDLLEKYAPHLLEDDERKN